MALALLLASLLATGSPVQADFVQTGSIYGATPFIQWVQPGVYSVTDGSDTGDNPAAEQDITKFWTAIGTANGGTSAPSSTNLITNFYYRVDTATTSATKFGKWNVQLNLGSAPAGQVDHLLQFIPGGTEATPTMTVQLSKYDTAQQVGAFTSGSLTAVTSTGASGRWAIVATKQSIEIAIPISWYTTPVAATSLVKADGTGVLAMYGAVFSSTGSPGAVGTVKDRLKDPFGNVYVIVTNLQTGVQSFQTTQATQLAYTGQPANTNAGATMGSVVVEIRDSGGVRLSTATHEVTLAIGTNPASGTLSGTKTVTAAAGVATFSDLSINNVGTGYTLVASAGGLTSATSSVFDIVTPVATKVGFVQQPTSATAGVALSPSLTVAVQTSGGATVTSSTASVTLAFGSNPGGGTLSGTLTRNAVAGIATFNDISINKAASGYTLVASSTGLTSATSSSFTISAAAANAAQTTANVPSGTSGIATTITITVRDAFGNSVTGATGLLAVAVSGANNASPSVSEVGGGVYSASYTPSAIGTDTVAITLGGVAISGSPYSSLVGAGGAANLGMITQPVGAAANVLFATQPVVEIQDAAGNRVTGDSTTQVTAAIFSGPGTLMGTVTKTAVNGVVTFTDLKSQAAGSITIRFTATGLTNVTSNALTITAGPANATLSTAVVPAGTSGSVTSITITVRDAFGNVVTGAVGQLAVSVSGANSAAPSVSDAGGGTYTASYTPSIAGTDNVAITLGGVAISGSPYASLVGHGPAAKLGILTQPVGAIANLPLATQPIIEIQDAAGNRVTSDSSTQVTAAIFSGPGALLGTTTRTAVNGVVTFTDLKSQTAGSITIRFTATGLASVTSNALTITAAAANAAQSSASVPGGTAGLPTNIVITLRDAFGNVVIGSAGLLDLAVTGANNAAPTASDNGDGSYAGSYTPSNTGTDNVAITLGGVAITGSPYSSLVGSSSPTKLGILTQPVGAIANLPFATQPIVEIQDAAGNRVSGDSSSQVTAAIFSGPGTLLGTTTGTAVAGVVTFTDLKSQTAGSITIRFTSNGLTSVTSNALTITAAAANAAQSTASVPAGTSGVATGITITVRDAFGNLVTGAAGQLAVAVSGANSAAPSVSETGGGSYSASYTPTFAGTDAVAITLGGVAISGSPYASLVGHGTAAKLGILVQPVGAAANVPFTQPVVEIQDAAGNRVVSDSTSQVSAAIFSGPGALLGATTKTAALGLVTFTDLKSQTAGTITIRFTSTGLTSVTSNAVVITAAAASTAQSSAVVPAGTAGSATSIVITLRDAFGNLVVGAGGLAVAVSGSNSASPTIIDNGDGTYSASYTPTVAGTDAIAITLGGLGLAGSPFSSIVSAGPAAAISAVQASFTGVAVGLTQSLEARVTDANGNPVSGISVSWAVTAGGGSVLGASSVSGLNGVASIVLTTGAAVGSNDVTATKAGLAGSPVAFSVATFDPTLAGLVIVQSGGSTRVSENRTDDVFTIALTKQPSGNVVVLVSSPQTDEASVSPQSLTFTTANWNTPQTITVSGVDDLLLDGDQSFSLVVSVDDANSSLDYAAVADMAVPVIVAENDAAAEQIFHAPVAIMTASTPQDYPMPTGSGAAFELVNVAVTMNAAPGAPMRVTINVLSNMPAGPTSAPPSVATLGQIWEMEFEDAFGNQLLFDGASFRFVVTRAWVDANCPPATCAVRIFHWDGAAWETLVPVLAAQDATTITYDVPTTSFSPFVLGGISIVAPAADRGPGTVYTPPPFVPKLAKSPDADPIPDYDPVFLPGPGQVVASGPTLAANDAVPAWAWALGTLVGLAATFSIVRPDLVRNAFTGARGLARATPQMSGRAWQAIGWARRGRQEVVPLLVLPAPQMVLSMEAKDAFTHDALRLNRLLLKIRDARRRGLSPDADVRKAAMKELHDLNQLFAELRSGKSPVTTHDLATAPEAPIMVGVPAALAEREAVGHVIEFNRAVHRELSTPHRDPEASRKRELKAANDLQNALRQIRELRNRQRSSMRDLGTGVNRPLVPAESEATLVAKPSLGPEPAEAATQARRLLGALHELQQAGSDDPVARARALVEARKLNALLRGPSVDNEWVPALQAAIPVHRPGPAELEKATVEAKALAHDIHDLQSHVGPETPRLRKRALEDARHLNETLRVLHPAAGPIDWAERLNQPGQPVSPQDVRLASATRQALRVNGLLRALHDKPKDADIETRVIAETQRLAKILAPRSSGAINWRRLLEESAPKTKT